MYCPVRVDCRSAQPAAGTVPQVRLARCGLAAVLVALALGVTPGTADAHVCPVAAIIPVGQPTNVTVAVTVEAVSVPDVQMDFPTGIQIDHAVPTEGWKITQSGQTLRYIGENGTTIQPFTCAYFAVQVTATAKGVYPVPVTQRDAKGTVVAKTAAGGNQKTNPYFIQTIYAGTKPPKPPGTHISTTVLAGGALIAFGVIMFGFLGLRSWRDRREDRREDEIDERLEEFKKQARDRAPTNTEQEH